MEENGVIEVYQAFWAVMDVFTVLIAVYLLKYALCTCEVYYVTVLPD